LFVQVETGRRERRKYRYDVRLIDSHDEVDVVGRPRFALKAGDDGARDHVVDPAPLQGFDDQPQ
jgi:hypothetical protein